MTTTWIIPPRGQLDVAATAEDIAAALALAPVVKLTKLDGGHVRVESAAWVGTVQSEHVRVVVQARGLSNAVIAGMLAECGGFSLPRNHVAFDAEPDLLLALTRALCDATASLVTRGLQREYATRIERANPIRGEIDLNRWHGPSSPEDALRPLCRYRDRTLDTPEHGVIGWVLAHLSSEPCVPAALRKRASHLAERIGVVPRSAPTVLGALRCRRTGRYAAYAAPLELACLLLQGLTSVSEGLVQGRGFLINVERLFEQWVVQQLRRWAPAGWSIRNNEHWVLAAVAIEPTREAALRRGAQLDRFLDAVVRDAEGHVCAVVDAKNKLFRRGSPPPRDDVHQIISYASAAFCDYGCLVGLAEATGAGVAEMRWQASWGHLTLEAVALPGLGTYSDLRTETQGWLERKGQEWQRYSKKHIHKGKPKGNTLR